MFHHPISLLPLTFIVNCCLQCTTSPVLSLIVMTAQILTVIVATYTLKTSRVPKNWNLWHLLAPPQIIQIKTNLIFPPPLRQQPSMAINELERRKNPPSFTATLKEAALCLHLSSQLFSTLTIPRSGNKPIQPTTDTHTGTPFVCKWKKLPPKSPNQTSLSVLSPVCVKNPIMLTRQAEKHVSTRRRKQLRQPFSRSWSRHVSSAKRKRRSKMMNASKRKSNGRKPRQRSARRTKLQPR
jgi:hypothetical protein